jgi:amino acid permease
MWFGWSLLLLLGIWFCMYSGGMYLLETNLCYRPSDSFDTLAGNTLGRTGRILETAYERLLMSTVHCKNPGRSAPFHRALL